MRPAMSGLHAARKPPKPPQPSASSSPWIGVEKKAGWPATNNPVTIAATAAVSTIPPPPPSLPSPPAAATAPLSPTDWSLLACALPSQPNEAAAYSQHYHRWRPVQPWPLPAHHRIAAAAHEWARAYDDATTPPPGYMQPVEPCWPLLFESLVSASPPDRTASNASAALELLVLRSNTLSLAATVLPAVHALFGHVCRRNDRDAMRVHLCERALQWLHAIAGLRIELSNLTAASSSSSSSAPPPTERGPQLAHPPDSHVRLLLGHLEAGIRSLPDPTLHAHLQSPELAPFQIPATLIGHALGSGLRRHLAFELSLPLKLLAQLALSTAHEESVSGEALVLIRDCGRAILLSDDATTSDEASESGDGGDAGSGISNSSSSRGPLGRRVRPSFSRVLDGLAPSSEWESKGAYACMVGEVGVQRAGALGAHEHALRGDESDTTTTAVGGGTGSRKQQRPIIEKGGAEWRLRMKGASADVQWIDALCFGGSARMRSTPYGPAGALVELPTAHSLCGLLSYGLDSPRVQVAELKQMPMRLLWEWLCALPREVMTHGKASAEPLLFSAWLHRGFDLIQTELLQPIASIQRELSLVCSRQLRAISSLIAPVGTLRQMIRKLATHCRNEEVRGARAHANPFLRADALPSTTTGSSGDDLLDGGHFRFGGGDETANGRDASAHALVLEALPSLLAVGGSLLNSLSVIIHTVGTMCLHASLLLEKLLLALAPFNAMPGNPLWTPFSSGALLLINAIEDAKGLVETQQDILRSLQEAVERVKVERRDARPAAADLDGAGVGEDAATSGDDDGGGFVRQEEEGGGGSGGGDSAAIERRPSTDPSRWLELALGVDALVLTLEQFVAESNGSASQGAGGGGGEGETPPQMGDENESGGGAATAEDAALAADERRYREKRASEARDAALRLVTPRAPLLVRRAMDLPNGLASLISTVGSSELGLPPRSSAEYIDAVKQIEMEYYETYPKERLAHAMELIGNAEALSVKVAVEPKAAAAAAAQEEAGDGYGDDAFEDDESAKATPRGSIDEREQPQQPQPQPQEEEEPGIAPLVTADGRAAAVANCEVAMGVISRGKDSFVHMRKCELVGSRQFTVGTILEAVRIQTSSLRI